ncbi:nitroreductase family protein [Anoxynatronum buryatiense]|uniref:Nitroreductase n=1 Tax=Anoxynatronum buryatiense TaxID=489973 RepID=A0AA45WZ52_9CLOT|nr:nitroreductase family protein [Anoxynatronum buryatiense]SMP72181.1 Nitroreductase [Anoxynatronum buryatiense]
MTTRTFEHEILDEVKKRWSPRAFDPNRSVSEADLMGVMESARYAPSCFNEQPWQYLVTMQGDEAHEKMAGVLGDTNREWASKAPVLMLILSRKQFSRNGKENRWHLFDAGTSWGYLSLEAQRRGLHTHAMGGFSVSRARETFEIGEDMSVIAAVAMGYYGSKEDLNPELQKKEKPAIRKSIKEILLRR